MRDAEFIKQAQDSILDSIREIDAALEQQPDAAFANPGFDESMAACKKVAAILGNQESQRMWSELEQDIQQGNTQSIREYLRGLQVRLNSSDFEGPVELRTEEQARNEAV